MSSGFSSSGCASSQAKEGIENVGGSEFATGGTHSLGMSSSGKGTNQADLKSVNEDNTGGRGTMTIGTTQNTHMNA